MTQADDALRVWFRLMRLHTRSRLAIASRLRAFDLSVPQCDVLTTLTEREGVSQQELAARLYVTKGNISGLIDRLVANGLVERRALRGDRRSHAIHLTDEGRDLARKGIEAQRAFVLETFGRLTPDKLRGFESLLVELREQMRGCEGAAVGAGAEI